MATRWDDWIGVIAVVVLLIGTATGNAFVMLGMSITIIALGLLALFRREQFRRGPILVAVMAAVTSTAIATFMATR